MSRGNSCMVSTEFLDGNLAMFFVVSSHHHQSLVTAFQDDGIIPSDQGRPLFSLKPWQE